MNIFECGCGDPAPVCVTRWVSQGPDRPVHYCDYGELHEGPAQGDGLTRDEPDIEMFIDYVHRNRDQVYGIAKALVDEIDDLRLALSALRHALKLEVQG